MSGDHLTTKTGLPATTAAIRADAAAYLTRTGNADLIEVLGLADPAPAVPVERGTCPICGNRLPSHGVCRKRLTCRAAAREQGAIA